jgi:phage regulator Rha-like protein
MLENDKGTWTSVEVAEQFDKRHRDVMRAIRDLLKKDPGLDAHYKLASHLVAGTNPQPYFKMDRRGYVVLTSSFTGEYALKIKQSLGIFPAS